MNFARLLAPFAATALLLSSNGAVEGADAPPYASSRMNYRIYGRDLGDPGPATSTDAKLSVFVDGKAAKELFDRLGKDQYDACTAGQDVCVRVAPGQQLRCQREADATYTCTLGIDLKTGRPIPGSVC